MLGVSVGEESAWLVELTQVSGPLYVGMIGKPADNYDFQRLSQCVEQGNWPICLGLRCARKSFWRLGGVERLMREVAGDIVNAWGIYL